MELHTVLVEFELSGERYAVKPSVSELTLDKQILKEALDHLGNG